VPNEGTPSSWATPPQPLIVSKSVNDETSVLLEFSRQQPASTTVVASPAFNGTPAAAAPPPQAKVPSYVRTGVLALLVVQNCAAVITIRETQHPSRPRFSSAAVMVVVELVKIVLCAAGVLYYTRSLGEAYRACVSKEAAVMLVPAGLYTLQNNLLFIALAALDSTVFQVAYQLKVLCTALLMVIMLGRRLKPTQWASLLLLFVGIVLTQLKKDDSGAAKPGTPAARAVDDSTPSATVGLIVVCICAICSAYASVHFERTLKSASSSLLARNVQLGFFSLIANVTWRAVANSGSTSTSAPAAGFFDGFDSLVWLLVFVQAAGGLLVAAVIKYADNILKGFGTAVAIVVNGILSVLYFGFEPTTWFLIGTACVIAATLGYAY
jgi:UDP-sugar transporter A1/2/3